jgi:hypothetical protein
MDFIHEKGTPDMFWTLSAADLQWPDLHRHMPQTEVDRVDYSRVQKLGGKHMQYRLDDYARRHHLVART